MAGINDKQRVNALNSNAAWLAKNGDDATIGKISLENNDVASGTHVDNLQKAINKIYEGLGTTGENDTTINNYSSSNYITNGDSRKVAIGKLDTKAKDLNDRMVAVEGVAGVTKNTQTITGNYTALVTDGMIKCSTNSLDVTLYAATGNKGNEITIVKTDADKSKIIIIKDSSGTEIYRLRLENQKITYYCDGVTMIEKSRSYGGSVVASYRCSTNKTSSPTAPTDFDTSIQDPFSLVTTGVNWKFTAPLTRDYRVDFVGAVGSAGTAMSIFKNTTIFSLLAYMPAGGYASGSLVIRLTEDDYIDFRSSASATITGGALSGFNVSQVHVTMLDN